MKKKKKKNNAQIIIGVLLTGDHLGSREISAMVRESHGRLIKIRDVASMLSKISNTEKSDLGHFIRKVKAGNGFVYHMVEEALGLSDEEAYDLTRKTGKYRYTLEQALRDFPELGRHVPLARMKKARASGKTLPKKPSAEKRAEKTASETPPDIADSLNLNINLKVGVKFEN